MSLGYQIVVGVVWVLAVARVTRLVNADVVFDPVRLWVARRLSSAVRAVGECDGSLRPNLLAVLSRRRDRWNTVTYFLGCPWCVSMWVAAATAWIPLWFHSNAVAVYAGVVLAASHVVGVAARWSTDEDIEIEES